MNSFYSPEELAQLGLGSYGKNVLISRYAHFYGAENMHFGDNVRIDDLCILSGKIIIGNFCHIVPGAMLFGGEEGIVMEDYTCISSRCAIYARSDDYSGEHMTNQVVPSKYTGVKGAQVRIGKHSIIGTGCTVLPGVQLAEGCSVGAMSLVNRSTEPWGIYLGIPARRVKDRKKDLLELCSQLEAELASK